MSKKRNKKRSNKPLHPADASLTRLCKCCQREMPLDKFYIGKSNKYSRRTFCKTCYSEEARYKNNLNPEKIIFIKRKWQKKFKNQKNKTNREYYARNREKALIRFKAYRERKKAEREANVLAEPSQNIRQIGQRSVFPPLLVQNREVESPPAQTFQFQGHQDYQFLVSCCLFTVF